jgi:hypothetical protein
MGKGAYAIRTGEDARPSIVEGLFSLASLGGISISRLQ